MGTPALAFHTCLLLLLASSRVARSSTGCKKPVDVVAVVDGSSSIGNTNFDEIKSALVRLVDGLGVSQTGTRLGIVLYSSGIRDRQTLSGNSTSLKSWITNLTYPGGGTGTDEGLRNMLEEFGDQGRPDVPQIGVVITDGSSNNRTLTKSEAAKAKAAGVIMFSVGIGGGIGRDELESIASSPERVILVEDFDNLLTQFQSLINDVCDAVDPDCTGVLDVVAVVDGSGSISSDHFLQVQQAVLKIVDGLNLKPDGTRLSIVLFASSVSATTDLNGDAAAVRAQINALQQPKGGTNTHLGLERMADIFRKQGRTGVARTGIVLTDGRSNNASKTEKAADVAKAEGISMFAVGIGSGSNDDELEAIASSPAQAVRVTDFDQLLKDVEGLVNQVCSGSSCNKNIELVAVVDGSGSISIDNFELMKNSLLQLVDTLNVNPDQIHMGVVLFESSVNKVLNLSGDPDDLKTKIANLTHPGGGTGTHLGLDGMVGLFQEQGREGVSKVGAVFTDGASNDRKATERAASRARQAGVNLLAVGVGSNVNMAELRAIASSPDQALQVDNFEGLAGILRELVSTVCQSQGLCDGCRLINGAGYNAHPTDCTKFVQCWEGEGGENIADVRSCPAGLFWDQDELTCNRPSLVNCTKDLCRHGGETTSYAFPGECREFWKCLNDVSVPRCCPEGTTALSNGTCVPSDICEDTCRHGSDGGGDDQEGPCNKRPVPGKPSTYKENSTGFGWMERPCPHGTAFDSEQCECVTSSQPPTPPSTQDPSSKCEPELYLPFTDGVKDESGHWTWVQNEGVNVSGGVAYFNGTSLSRLRVTRFTNFQYGSTFVVSFRYLAEGDAEAAQALVSNGGCDDSPTFFVSHTRPRSSTTNVQFGFVNNAGQTTSVSLGSSRRNWKSVVFAVSDGRLTGTVGASSRSAQGSGTIGRNHCALQIGGGTGIFPYRGYIDDLRVYLCSP